MIFGARRLAQHRIMLLERAAHQRRITATALAPLAERAAVVDRLIATVRTGLPWATGALTIYALLRPKPRQAKDEAGATTNSDRFHRV
jgi:hypothetical protein